MPRRVSVFLEVLALISFALTLFLLWSDKTASAGVAVALGFGALLFRVLPDLESFEILGLKAKLRERLQEADRILGMMRDLASVTTKASVMNTAWSNRMGGLSYAQQSELLDQQAHQLEVLGVNESAIREVKRPAIALFSFDLGILFCRAVQDAGRKYSAVYQQRLQDLGQPLAPELEAQRKRNMETTRGLMAAYSDKISSNYMQALLQRREPVGEQLNALIDQYRWSTADRNALRGFAAKISVVDAYNWASWRLGPELQDFLEKRPYDYNLKEEVFPGGISGPDWNVVAETSGAQ